MPDRNELDREILLEKYSFTASNGKAYHIRPATVKDIIGGEFKALISKVGIPDLTRNARVQYAAMLQDEESRGFLDELIKRYVFSGNEPQSFEMLAADGFTIDDLILLIKRLIGISE